MKEISIALGFGTLIFLISLVTTLNMFAQMFSDIEESSNKKTTDDELHNAALAGVFGSMIAGIASGAIVWGLL